MENLIIIYQHVWNFVWVLAIFGAVFYFIRSLKLCLNDTDASVRFVGRFRDCSPEYRLVPNKTELKTILILIGVFFAVRIASAAAAFILRSVYDPDYTFKLGNMLSEFIKWDSHHYIGIADRWYVNEGDPRFHIVFYPMFPIFVKGFSYIFGSTRVAAFIQPNLFAAASIAVMYKLLRLDFSRRVTKNAILIMIFSPYAFFLSLPFTESTFLLATLLFMLMLKRENWIIAGVCGFVAALTKNFGLLLIVPYGVWLITVTLKRKLSAGNFLLRLLPGLLILGGFGVYLYINYSVTGNPFQFMIYQKEHWYNEISCILENTVNHFSNFLREKNDIDNKWFLWFGNVIAAVGTMAAIYIGRKKIPFLYSIYTLACMFLMMTVSWLLSGPRYMLPIFPIFVSFALFTEKRNWILYPLLALGFLLGIAVLVAFLSNGPIM